METRNRESSSTFYTTSEMTIQSWSNLGQSDFSWRVKAISYKNHCPFIKLAVYQISY